ncbi:hypothetical protein Tco_0743716 [Tanacetum coccineum]
MRRNMRNKVEVVLCFFDNLGEVMIDAKKACAIIMRIGVKRVYCGIICIAAVIHQGIHTGDSGMQRSSLRDLTNSNAIYPQYLLAPSDFLAHCDPMSSRTYRRIQIVIRLGAGVISLLVLTGRFRGLTKELIYLLI